MYSRMPRISLTTASAPAALYFSSPSFRSFSFSASGRDSYSSLDSPRRELPSRIPMVKTPAFFPYLMSEMVSPAFITLSTALTFSSSMFLNIM